MITIGLGTNLITKGMNFVISAFERRIVVKRDRPLITMSKARVSINKNKTARCIFNLTNPSNNL